MVRLYFRLAELGASVSGQAFNVGGGLANSLSLLELFDHLERRLEIALRYTRLTARYSDQKVFVADNTKLQRLTGWTPAIGIEEGLERLLRWLDESAAEPEP